MPTERNRVIDVMRGLLILCVVLGHTASPFIFLVYSFHMPAWFILSGFLHRDRGPRALVTSKLATLMVPYLAANLATWALVFAVSKRGSLFILQGLKAKPMDFDSLWLLVTKLQPINPMMGATWFLPVLFGVSLVAALLIHLARRAGLRGHVLLAASLGLALYGKSLGWTSWFLDLILFCQLFYIIGYLVAGARVALDPVKAWILTAVAAGALGFQYLIYNQFFNLAGRRYCNVALLILFTCAGAYLLYVASRHVFARIPYVSEALTYIGRRSLYILLFHFYAFKAFSLLLFALGYPKEYIYTFPTPGTAGYPHWYLYIAFGIGFSLLAGLVFDWLYRIALGVIAPRNTTIKSVIHDFLFKDSLA